MLRAILVAASLLVALPGQALAAPGAPENSMEIIARNRQDLQMDHQLAIRSVVPNRTQLGQYEKLELTIGLRATYDNPYDRRQVGVEAVFEREHGDSVIVPGFYYVPYEPQTPGTILTGNAPYKRLGDPCWKVRFTPRRPGAYRCRVRAYDSTGGEVTADGPTFNVDPGDDRGFVRVASGNPRYFEFETGELFFPIGANVAWTHEYYRGKRHATYEYYFDKLAGAGANATRVWMCHWSWLEWTPKQSSDNGTFSNYAGAGYYNQKVACAFDRIFRRAAEKSLCICLCTDDNNEHMTGRDSYDSWEWNPYNAKNGGPCRAVEEFWTHPEARRLYKRRLSYINARWGYSPAFWCWNLWNDCSKASPKVVNWLSEVYGHAKNIQTNFPDRSVGTNFGHAGAGFYDEIMDYVNGGGGPIYFRRAAHYGDYWRRKPFVQLECPFDRDPEWFLHSVHTSFWRAIAQGLAGAMCWNWQLFDECGWREFKPVIDFVDPLPLNTRKSESFQPRLRHVQLDDPGTPFIIPVELEPLQRWGAKAPREKFRVSIRGCPDQTQLYANLYGYGRPNWRTTPHFDIDSPRGGNLIIEVAEIGGGTQVLQAELDGGAVLRKTLADGRRLVTAADDKYVNIAIPPGRHDLLLSNEGGDWLRVRRYRFLFEATDAESFPPVEVIGRRGSDFALLWLCNIYDTKTAKLLNLSPRVVREAALDIGPLQPGTYSVEWYDTHSGTVIRADSVRAEDGNVTTRLPRALQTDMACRVLAR